MNYKVAQNQLKHYFDKFTDEEKQEKIVEIYNLMDETAIKNGRYVFPPGIDPIVVYNTLITLKSMEDGRENTITIGEVIETVINCFIKVLSKND